MAGPRPETLKREKSKRKISDKAFQYTLDLMSQHLSFEAAPNRSYTPKEINMCLLYMCLNEEYAEGGMSALSSEIELPNRVPTGRTVRNRLQTQNAREILAEVTQANDALLYKLRQFGVFRRRVTVAIDFTRNLFYGDHEHTPRVLGGKYEKGTCYGYKYASIHVVEAGKRLTICTLPIDEFSEKVDVVEKLLSEAKVRGIHIGYVLLDREFFTEAVIQLLKSLHLKFIMPAVKNDKVKDAIRRYHNKEAPAVQRGFPLGKETFTLVVYEKTKEQLQEASGIVDRYFVFATNLSEPKARCLYSFIPQEYKRRWGIETGYRVQDDAEAMTTSTNYAYRLLLHLCSVLVYNIWQYANLLLAKVLHCTLSRPLVALKILASHMQRLIVCGLGPPKR